MLHRTPSRVRAPSSQAGQTLLELIMACAILLILATSALPVARFTVKRNKETQLRLDLREMRNAIDAYKDAADRNLIQVEAGTEGYPPDLATLVMGVDLAAGAPNGTNGTAITGQAGGIGSIGTGGIGGIGGPGITPPGSTGFSSSLSPPAGASALPSTLSTPAGAASSSNPVTRHVRFLRRIPVDPFTGDADWGVRSVQDDPDSSSWGGHDVFDIFSRATGTALDGTKYSDW
jgi:type II secretory pathway pseudopilin PulG